MLGPAELSPTAIAGSAPVAPSRPVPDPGSESLLLPYVPRLTLEWLRADPERTFQVLDGTMAFVDISGFTRLTELLAARGKAGAEELTGFLDGMFADLIGIAYRHSGELIKWGGDAVLVWYGGDSHAERAVAAAWRMQQTIKRIGRVRTSVGPSTLRMSVGINSGQFHFFLVGRHHRELLVTGPAATETARMERIAEAGEIVVSRDTASELSDASLGAAKADGILIAAPPAVRTARSARMAPANLDWQPSLCLPAELSQHLRAAPVESEHRQVAVAFVEFSGSGEALAEVGEAGLAAALQELMDTIQEICVRNQVTFWETDISEDGGKVMLVAGAPRATDDDDGRMLIAVREILDRASRLRLRAGVNRGRVFASGFGPSYRRTYSAKGDAVNLAARLMARANVGELYASDGVLRHSRIRFSASKLEPFLVKGKAVPVEAHLVEAVTTASVPDQRASGVLVGREREFKVLEEALGSARRGRGSWAEIVGPPGIGKSRLIEAVRERAVGMRLITVVCDEYRETIPFATARNLLRQSLAVDADADAGAVGDKLTAAVMAWAPNLAPWLPLLADVSGAAVAATPETTALDRRFRNERLESTFVDLLSLSLPDPTLLVFDDAQWMDESSASLLRALAAKVDSRPWLLVTGRRPQPGGLAVDDLESRVRRELQPLSEEAVAQLLRAVTSERPLAPHQRAAISTRSGGNPLFLLELVQAGQQAGFDTALPDSVESLLASQVDRLSPPDRHLLRVASVLGMQVDLAVLAEMLEGQHAARRLAALDDFFSPDSPGALRFRHTMLRDAAYEGLPYSRRRELHAKAGAVLERMAGRHAGETAGLLALHFGNAAQHRSSWHYARLAGEHARSIFAHVEAARFFEQALTAARALRDVSASDLMEVAESLGDARSRLGEFASAASAYRTAQRWATTAPARARLLHKVALTTDRAGDYQLTLRTLTRAERSLGVLDDPNARRLRAEVRALYGLVRHRQGRGLDAVGLLQDAVALAEQAEAAEVLATALIYLDIAELTVGHGDTGHHAQRALGILGELGNQPWLEARALNQLGIRAYFAGNWSEAVAYYTQSRDACLRAGDEWTAAVTAGNIAEVLSDQGHLEQAEAILEDALRTYQAARTPTFIGYGTMLMGRLLTRRGDFARAVPLLEEARQLAAAGKEATQLLQAETALAEHHLLAGSPAAAVELAERALGRAASVPGGAMVEPSLERIVGMALMNMGQDPLAARRHILRAVESSRAKGARYDLAMSLEMLAHTWPDALGPSDREELPALTSQLGLVGQRWQATGQVGPLP